MLLPRLTLARPFDRAIHGIFPVAAARLDAAAPAG